MRYSFLLISLIISTLALSSCGLPYRIDIDQGNIITADEVSRLQIGMSKEDVRLIVGDPLLNDVFHQERWDYVQYHQSGKTREKQKGLVSLYFTHGLLTSINSNRLTELKKEPVNYQP